MRIGFFTDTYLPVSNGICYVIDIIRKDLEAAGHEVYVVAPQNVFNKPAPQKRVIRLSALQGVLYSDQFSSFFWPARRLKKLENLNLDCAIIFTPSLIGGLGVYVALRLGIPYVVQYGTDMEAYAKEYRGTTIVGLLGSLLFAPHFLKMGLAGSLKFYASFFKKNTNLARSMIAPMHQKAAAIIAISEKTANQLSKWPIKQKIVIIPTGVNALPADLLSIKSFRHEFGINERDQVVLYAGRLSVEKNLELLIDAFDLVAKKLPRAKLLMAGDFQHRKHLEKRAEQLIPGKVIFAGQLDRALMGSVYALADIFALPSLTDCQALVLNEAAHAGLPLVWCDTPQLNPILTDQLTGLQAKPTSKDLAQKIMQLLSSPKKRQTYGTNAQKAAKAYSEPAQSKKIENLLKSLVKTKQG